MINPMIEFNSKKPSDKMQNSKEQYIQVSFNKDYFQVDRVAMAEEVHFETNASSCHSTSSMIWMPLSQKCKKPPKHVEKSFSKVPQQ